MQIRAIRDRSKLHDNLVLVRLYIIYYWIRGTIMVSALTCDAEDPGRAASGQMMDAGERARRYVFCARVRAQQQHISSL